jgi:hypothetical protein
MKAYTLLNIWNCFNLEYEAKAGDFFVWNVGAGVPA